MPKNYDTPLTPDETLSYKEWLKQNDIPSDSRYDMQGYYHDLVEPGHETHTINPIDHRRHFPDTYKKPDYPTFSDDSKYAVGADRAKAGHWIDEQFYPAGLPYQQGQPNIHSKLLNMLVPSQAAQTDTEEFRRPGIGMPSALSDKPLPPLAPYEDPLQAFPFVAGGAAAASLPVMAHDIGTQWVFGKVLDRLMGKGTPELGTPPAPEQQLDKPDWYKVASDKPRYTVPDTARLGNQLEGFGIQGGDPNKTIPFGKREKKFLYDQYPEYHSRIPPLVPVGDNPPDPGQMIFHGLATDLQHDPVEATDTALGRLGMIQQKGLNQGWFSERPHHPFGPLFVGTKTNPIMKTMTDEGEVRLEPRRPHYRLDPSVELVPRYNETIPPHRLWLVDHKGNLLGKLAPEPGSPGEKEWKQSASEFWGQQGGLLAPGEDDENTAWANEQAKQFKLGKWKPTDPDIGPDFGPIMEKGLGPNWNSELHPSDTKKILSPFDEAGKMTPWSMENVKPSTKLKPHEVPGPKLTAWAKKIFSDGKSHAEEIFSDAKEILLKAPK